MILSVLVAKKYNATKAQRLKISQRTTISNIRAITYNIHTFCKNRMKNDIFAGKFNYMHQIIFHKEELSYQPVFSILIPTWNNLGYIKKCIESIRKNSHFQNEIIVHVNEGTDGTLEWIKEQKLSYTHSKTNIGVCYGFNSPSALASSDLFILLDDDNYVAPDWDLELKKEVDKVGHVYFTISGTLVEHSDSGNKCVIVKDYGKNVEEFQEENFLKEHGELKFRNWTGGNWYPLVIHKYIWALIGGLSIEFTPGMYSDPDFMKKLWHAGVRYFKGIEASKSYHFGSKTTGRVKKNNGRKQFALKWGVNNSTFFKYYLRIGDDFTGETEEPKLSFKLKRKLFIDKFKQFWLKF